MAFTETMKVSFEPQQMELVHQQAKALGMQPAVYVRVKTLEALQRERTNHIG